MPCCRKGNCGSPVNLEILGDAHLLVLKTTRFLVVLLAPPFFVLLVFGDVFIKFSPTNYPEEHLSTLSLERLPAAIRKISALRPHSFRERKRLDPRERVLANNQLMPCPH